MPSWASLLLSACLFLGASAGAPLDAGAQARRVSSRASSAETQKDRASQQAFRNARARDLAGLRASRTSGDNDGIRALRRLVRVEGKIPVEVRRESSGQSRSWLRLVAGSGGRAVLRRTDGGRPYVTEGGHHVVDVVLGTRPRGMLRSREGRRELADKIDGLPGVVDHGLSARITGEDAAR